MAQLFRSFFQGGFECSTHRRADGVRLDLIASSGHDGLVLDDYLQLASLGIFTVRDGARWHLIERAPGEYDWSSLVRSLRAARVANVQVIWDLCHYGYPDHLDIWSDAFVAAFARFARQAAIVAGNESDGPPLFCPINEISYWAWAGAETGRINPGVQGRGAELKRQLVRASIAAIHAVREVDSNQAHEMDRQRGSVEFRNVSFHYDRRGATLRDFSLYVPPGQKLGVAGPSGAGKSTLINLMQRLYDVQSGAVLIDGQRVEDITQDSLRESLSVVPQEISLFHRTVMDNIRFGRPDATDEEVIEAARAACCDEFARRLPEGYDTIVGERGVKLSGGQRQRIGIARAFLKKAPILIMDEATSALDTESEMQIQRNLVEKLQGRTVIAVAHRLSTLVGFDRIIVVVDGRIVEEGTAAELRARNGVFEKLWRLQTEGLAISEPAQRRRA